MCYTNHALDQFLKDMLPFTDKIVRVGGRCSLPELEKVTLRAVQVLERAVWIAHRVQCLGGAVDRCCTPRAWYGGVGNCSVVSVTAWHRNLHCPGALTARRRRCDSHSSKSRQPAYQGSTLRGTAHSEGRLVAHHRRVSVMEVQTRIAHTHPDAQSHTNSTHKCRLRARVVQAGLCCRPTARQPVVRARCMLTCMWTGRVTRAECSTAAASLTFRRNTSPQ